MQSTCWPDDTQAVAPIRTSTAFAWAAQCDVPCVVVQWLTLEQRRVRVALATTDPDPTVSLAAEGRLESWLEKREESAPDRWDYHAELPSCRTLTGLRLGQAPNFSYVTFLPAELAVITAHGWAEHFEEPAESLLDRNAFQRALEEQSTDGRDQ